MMQRHMQQRLEAPHTRDLHTFHNIVQNTANHPAYTRPLPRREQKQFSNTPLKKVFSPAEQAYLRAHAVRQEAYAATRNAADEAVRAKLPEYPDSFDERYWSSQTAWASKYDSAMAHEVNTPRFATHLRSQIMQRTGGHLLAPVSEAFLAKRRQAYLYARTGALALYKEFGPNGTFNPFTLEQFFEKSMERDEAEAVQNVLVNDHVLHSEGSTMQVNTQAAEQLKHQQVYVPPQIRVPRRF